VQNPNWAQELPAHIRLSSSQIERLEIIRGAVGISDGEFRLHIASHPECSKMLQRTLYQRYQSEQPGQPTEFYLACIVWSRYATAQITGGDLFGLRAMLPNAEALNDPETAMAAVADVVRKHGWRNIEEVAQAISDEESALPRIEPAPGYEDAVRQVTLILRENPRA
jgi:hypothetical protein